MCFIFLTSSFGSDWKKVYFSLLTLHHICQGALPLAGCLHAAVYFLCSELLLIAVLLPVKLKHGVQVFYVFSFQLCSTANSKVSFNVSLCEINCIKIHAISLVLNRFSVFYLLWCHHSPVTDKKFIVVGIFLLRKWSKCVLVQHTAHAQRSYLTVVTFSRLMEISLNT